MGQAKAAITYSGIVDITITNTFEGVYLDLGNPEDNPSPDPDSVGNDNYTIGYSPTLPNWDVNFFFGGAGILHSESFSPFVDDTVGQGAQILNVTTGGRNQVASMQRHRRPKPTCLEMPHSFCCRRCPPFNAIVDNTQNHPH